MKTLPAHLPRLSIFAATAILGAIACSSATEPDPKTTPAADLINPDNGSSGGSEQNTSEPNASSGSKTPSRSGSTSSGSSGKTSSGSSGTTSSGGSGSSCKTADDFTGTKLPYRNANANLDQACDPSKPDSVKQCATGQCFGPRGGGAGRCIIGCSDLKSNPAVGEKCFSGFTCSDVFGGRACVPDAWNTCGGKATSSSSGSTSGSSTSGSTSGSSSGGSCLKANKACQDDADCCSGSCSFEVCE
jgi:hypothetical protein